MKKTTYKCDRCGASLGEHGEALRRTRFCTQTIEIYKFKFFSNWKSKDLNPIVYDLCEDCRNALDIWIGDY